MSISSYQYDLIKKSYASIQPNFHCFFISFKKQLKKDQLYFRLPSAPEHLFLIESKLNLFLSKSITHLSDHKSLLNFVNKNIMVLKHIFHKENDIIVVCKSLHETLKIHLGRQFNPLTAKAWTHTLLIIFNLFNEILFGSYNVVCIEKYKQNTQ